MTIKPLTLHDHVGIGIMAGSPMLALGVVALQCFWYLRDGAWTAISIADAAAWVALQFDPMFLFGNSWLVAPTSWLGLHKVLSYLPLSGSVVAVGFAVGLFIVKVGEDSQPAEP